MVVPGLQNDNVRIRDEIDEAIGLVDAPRPGSRQNVLERLGLADSCERISQHIQNEDVDALQSLPILPLPIDVVLPPIYVERKLPRHASNNS